MKRLFAVCVLGLALVVEPVLAMPRAPAIEPPAGDNALVVKVATKYQKRLARQSCRRQYGNRLAYVSFSGNRYVCHFRKTNKQLTKEASRSCRKSGYRLKRVTSIRIKGNKSITRFVCTRR
jgi:hypothetical protein